MFVAYDNIGFCRYSYLLANTKPPTLLFLTNLFTFVICFVARRRQFNNSGSDSIPMKGLKEHQTSIRNDGFSNDGNASLPIVVGDLPHTTPSGPYEEIDNGQHTYEALSERDKDTSYQKIIKQPISHHVMQKSVSLLLLMT